MINNILNRNRLMNIFGQPRTPTLPNQVQLPDPMQDVRNPTMPHEQGDPFAPPQMMTREQDNYHNVMDQMPTYQDPSILKRIMAVLASYGQGGIANGQRMLEMPYNRDMEAFKIKAGFAEKSADNERNDNVNRRVVWSTELQNKMNQDRLRETQERNDQLTAKETEAARLAREKQESLDKDREAKNAIAVKRNEISNFKATHPDWKAVTSKGGTVHFVNPQDPTMIVDTGLDTGTLSDMDKMTLQLDNDLRKIGATGDERLKQIGASGDEARKTVTARGEVEKDLIPLRGEQARTTKSTPSGSSLPTGSKTLFETEASKAKRRLNNVNELKLVHPEWAKYVKQETGGQIKVASPGILNPNLTKDMRDAIVAFIDKKDAALPANKAAGNTTTTDEKVEVIAPDGTPGKIPKSQLEAALAQGYKKK